MKKSIILLTAVLLASCGHKPSYVLKSMCADYKDTIVTKILSYSTPIKVGDTVLVWHTDTVGSNYIIKSIK